MRVLLSIVVASTVLLLHARPSVSDCTFCVDQLYDGDSIIEFSSSNGSVSCAGLLELIDSGLSTMSTNLCEEERISIEDACCKPPTAPPTQSPTNKVTSPPTPFPTRGPRNPRTPSPTNFPSVPPTEPPTVRATTLSPTKGPTNSPTISPVVEEGVVADTSVIFPSEDNGGQQDVSQSNNDLSGSNTINGNGHWMLVLMTSGMVWSAFAVWA